MIQKNYNLLINGLNKILPYRDLREAQLTIFNNFLLESDKNLSKGFFDLATGFGKTRMMNVLTDAYLSQNPNGKVIIVVPTQALIRDENGDGMIKRFKDFHQMYYNEPLSIGAFYTHAKNIHKNIIVTTYSSLNTLTKKINSQEVGLLLLDEAHHSLSETRIESIKKFSNACTYGLTATPAYSPDKNLENLLGSVISEMNTVQAVKDGLLTPCKNILLSSKIKVDLSNVSKTTNGEYDQTELDDILNKALTAYQTEGNAKNWKNAHELIANEIAIFYQNFIDETIGPIQNKKCMINCRSQSEAQLQARALNKLFGKTIAAAWTSNTKDKTILNKFVNGDIHILCQVGKLSEGFDMPELDICINYPTCSRVVEAQRGGRVLRLNPKNTNKFALIVDIVFSHPDFDNPILSSHVNGQVLYRDITNQSVILNNQTKSIYPKNPNENDIKRKSTPILSLEALNIISNIEELIRLENNANTYLNTIKIQQKREGMLTNVDLAKLFHREVGFFKDLLQQCHQNKICFTTNGIRYPLVEKIQAKTMVCFAIHEHPNALIKLKNIALKKGINLDIPQKREGMKTIKDLCAMFHKEPDFFKNILEKYYQEKKYFEVDGIQYPLVEKIKNARHISFALHEHPKAIEIFKQYIEMDFDYDNSSQKQKSLTALSKLLHIKKEIINQNLQRYYENNKKFEIDGKTYPLVKKIRQENSNRFALHEHPKAFDIFKELLIQQGLYEDVPQKRKGMKSSSDLKNILNKETSIILPKLQQLYKDNASFVVDNKSYPLVEKIKSGKFLAFALNEHPKAFEIFKDLLKKEGLYTDVPSKRNGMKSPNDLEPLLKKNSRFLKTKLEKYYIEKQQIKIGNKSFFLVEKVKSGKQIIFALHEHPLAIKHFKKLLEEDGTLLDIPNKRNGMKSSNELVLLFKKGKMFFYSYLQKLYLENRTFSINGFTYPLVEKVKNGLKPGLALHEHPKALEIFQHLVKQEGIILEPRKITTQNNVINININNELEKE